MSAQPRSRVVTVFALTLLAAAASAQPHGTYSVRIGLAKTDTANSIALCSYRVTLALDAGTGLLFVPLPFGRTKRSPTVLIDEGTDRQLVLTGTVLPTESYSAIAVPVRAQPGKIIVEFADVALPLRQYSRQADALAVAVLLRQATSETRATISDAVFATPVGLQFWGEDFTASQPASQSADDPGVRVIAIHEGPPDVLLYVSERPARPYLLLALLAPVGILLGVWTTPRLSVTGKRAGILAAASAALLCALAAVFVIVLPTRVRLNDTGVILTFGTLAGVLIGSLGSSLLSWRRFKKSRVAAA